jgi:MerR family copper efflux transcriptional regulator
MNVHDRVFTIGALAKATEVSTPTIRYYEEIGLLPPASRTTGGQRSYDRDDLSRLTFIKQCRDFGFGIDQVRVLLDLSISAVRDCAETRDIAKSHLAQVQDKLAELRALEERLQGFVERCNAACAGGPGQDCVIFKDLSEASGRRSSYCCG